MDPFGNSYIMPCHHLVIQVESILPLPVIPINFIIIETQVPGEMIFWSC